MENTRIPRAYETMAVLGWLQESQAWPELETQTDRRVPRPQMRFLPAHSANYTNASRTADDIDAIVIHTVEGTASGAITWFQDPRAQVSAHFVVSKAGEITQMVEIEDIAWTQTYCNQRAIGIECEGRASDPDNWTEPMMRVLAQLAAWLCQSYGIPAEHPTGKATANTQQGRFRKPGLIGHSQLQPWNKSDPGPYFPWDRLIRDIGAWLGNSAFTSAQNATTNASAAQQPQQERPQTTARGARSGAAWRRIADANGWVNSTAFANLDASWGPRAEAFVSGLRAAGAQVIIKSALRHPNRAFLMHYAWGVAHGSYTPAQANAACRGRGIDIEWGHGDLAASRIAAQAMVKAFRMVHQASINGNHPRGLAIDIDISNLPASITMNGKTYTTERGASGVTAAASVAPIGRDMGVIWFGPNDYVHWSHNGK
jgi:N-acetyl-anhydromuramyl-L-alanine amidase AmpD